MHKSAYCKYLNPIAGIKCDWSVFISRQQLSVDCRSRSGIWLIGMCADRVVIILIILIIPVSICPTTDEYSTHYYNNIGWLWSYIQFW